LGLIPSRAQLTLEKPPALEPEPAFLAQAPKPAAAPQPPQYAPGPAGGPLGEGPWQLKRRSDERGYSSAMRALEAREWARAAELFTEAAAVGGSRAEGALYWKAYALNKLGRRDEALSTIEDLRKAYPSSRWLNDAKALEVEVRQAAGRPVTPETETDDELKLMALNALVQSDPERAIPILDKLLKGAHSPKLKERALFVLSQSRSAKGAEMLAAVAREGNPELQMKAIQYLGVMGSRENRQLLAEIYSASTDAAVKRSILRSFMVAGDWERLAALAKEEKVPEVRAEAIRQLGVMGPRTGEALTGLYTSESDAGVRREVINALFVQNNARALIDIARKETDPNLKKEAVRKLSVMKNREATDYLMELLNK
jgi:HEAT repeat protein